MIYGRSWDNKARNARTCFRSDVMARRLLERRPRPAEGQAMRCPNCFKWFWEVEYPAGSMCPHKVFAIVGGMPDLIRCPGLIEKITGPVHQHKPPDPSRQ